MRKAASDKWKELWSVISRGGEWCMCVSLLIEARFTRFDCRPAGHEAEIWAFIFDAKPNEVFRPVAARWHDRLSMRPSQWAEGTITVRDHDLCTKAPCPRVPSNHSEIHIEALSGSQAEEKEWRKTRSHIISLNISSLHRTFVISRPFPPRRRSNHTRANT